MDLRVIALARAKSMGLKNAVDDITSVIKEIKQVCNFLGTE
jgi:hypothetical protein